LNRLLESVQYRLLLVIIVTMYDPAAFPPPFAMGPGPMGPGPYGPGAVPLDVASVATGSIREEEDFTFFRYSRAKVPLLLFILAIFVTVILLTMWQSRSDIRGLKAGVPRDLEPPTSGSAKEGGIPKYKRNLRFAATSIGIFFALVAFVVYLMTTLKPVLRAKINYLIAFILIGVAVLAFIALALDINSERDARRCTNNIHYSRVCENREDIATGLTVFDAGLGVFALTAGLLIFFYSRSGDWTRAHDPKLIAYLEDGPAQLQPGMYPNGVSYVRKWLVTLALAGTVVLAILLLVFTILINEDRDRYSERDLFNRQLEGTTVTRPGWPVKNTKLRYATCSIVILAILLNLIPLTSRVIAYVFGLFYFVAAVLSFVMFAIDVDSMQDAKQLLCPDNLRCVYHPYNATAAIEFIGGVFLLVYIILEYFVLRRRKVQQPAVVFA
jgi:magnesium-transporting ATPase (P-type)